MATLTITTPAGVVSEAVVGPIKRAVLAAILQYKATGVSVTTADENGPVVQEYDGQGRLLRTWRQPALLDSLVEGRQPRLI